MTDFQAAAIAAAVIYAARFSAPFSEHASPGDPKYRTYESTLRAILEAMQAAHEDFAR